ncbi:MAG: hypothetical protein GWM90_02840 [Gemmatimonadetes bacterium]|nr:putative glycoside hydrolase [Gemmatimonadota bacterium]NIQ52556.1 putative glycoside hydrolase [Gemmatimonadota bacterium]NIU72694.1 hypothetical protein [Gammaproteobacteria bacterium]NIX43100.1 hypothetical protein [Gemmatimonadota bacterium]NIY07262.1 hypothetical protein [Gemmatimonadota bacterium]
MPLSESRWLKPGTRTGRQTLLSVVALVLAVGIGAIATRSGEPGRAARAGDIAELGTPGAGEAGPGAEAGTPAWPVRIPDPDPVPRPPPPLWAEPTEPSPVTPVPADQRVPKPDAVRGIYIGAWSAGSARRLARLIDLADATEINTFVIDVKDVTGEISYATRLPLAQQVGADRERKIADVRALLDRLREHGIYPIARIVVFKDPLLANARREWAITREDGTIWEDDNGVHWVDSFNRDVWDYNIELAREAVALGFSEVQWDYVRFPDVPRSYLLEAVYPAREGRTKPAAIREFMQYSKERLADLDVPVTADVFGITTSTRRDVGIGQVWEEMSDVMDVLLPMVYPSHYPAGSWDYPNPNAAPYQIVKKAMDDGVERSERIEGAAEIRPWLQAFSLGEPAYGPRHIRAQIDAVYDAGLTEWILWHPGVRYPAEAFADARGAEPWFSGMGEMLYRPEGDDRYR